jgi:chorismate synthase
MAGSSFGRLFKITSFGESHGPAVGVIVDGAPSGLTLSLDDAQKELDRRRPGQSPITSAREEEDKVEILSGLFQGKTTGAPICFMIRNQGADPAAYEEIKRLFRPGHADFTYQAKYGLRDWRGGGRASGRETAGRVAAGAVAKKILRQRDIQVIAYTIEVAGIRAVKVNLDEIEKNPLRCPDRVKAGVMEEKILAARKAGDSLGGIVEIVIRGCPAGLGDPVFDKLDAELAKALLSIGAVKGVEFGAGFQAAEMSGSQFNDSFVKEGGKTRTKTNNAGGILGGISTGEEITARVAVRPPASISKPQRTVDSAGHEATISVDGRHDPCICPRIVPVVEAMAAIVLVDRLMIQASISSDLR